MVFNEFSTFKKYETEIAGRPFVVEVGKMAQLAGGSCLVRYGETNVLCTATPSGNFGMSSTIGSIGWRDQLYVQNTISICGACARIALRTAESQSG